MGYAASSLRTRRNLADVPQHIIGDVRGVWSVIVPEESTNLVLNPSLEVNQTSWTLSHDGSSSFDRLTSESAFGAASGRLIRVGGTFGYVTTNSCAVSALSAVTLSAYVKTSNPSGVGITGFEYTSGAVFVRQTPSTMAKLANAWERLVVTTTVSATTAAIYLVFTSSANGTYYIDGAQVEAKAFPTTYIDGDQEGCVWVGTVHGSQSFRSGSTRKGGRVWNFRDFKFSVNAIVGAGAAALTTIATPYALTGGGFYQRSVAPPRSFQIVGGFECASDVEMHRLRQEMLDAVKPYATSESQQARLVYEPTNCLDSAGKKIVIDAVYTGGLEGNWTNDGGRENAAVGFQSFLPLAAFGKSEVDRAAALTVREAFTAGGNNLVRRNLRTGDFDDISSTLNSGIRDFVLDRAGGFYAGGPFTSPQTRIMRWDGSAYSALSTGANGEVHALTLSAANVLIAGGVFTSIGGVGVTGLAYWDGAAWNGGLGSVAGGSAAVYAIVTDSSGGIWIGGSFTSVNGVAANNIAYWTGSVWVAPDTGVSSSVFALALGSAGLYVGGGFTSVGSGPLAANGLALWNGSAWSNIGSVNGGGYVGDIVIAPDNRVYISGGFSSIGGVTAANIAVWNGSVWSALGSGVNGAVDTTTLLNDGTILVSGAFTSAGGLAASKSAIWNGSAWVWSDLYLVGSGAINATESDGLYEYYQGTAATTFWTSGSTTITDVAGTSVPEIRLSGPGTIYRIKNWTTGDEILFNLALLTGETAVLKLGSNPSFISSSRGNILSTILPSSDLSTFRLLPGTNYISCLANTASLAASIVWRDQFDSLDAASK